MGQRRIRGSVDWEVQRSPAGLMLGRLGGEIAAAVFAGMSWSDWDWRSRGPVLPDDPQELVDLGGVFITGETDWLPSRWGPQLVQADARAAWIDPAGLGHTQQRIPLDTLSVVAARSRSRSRRPRHATAPWTLDLADGSRLLELTGPWLSLAWIGHLAEWPDPNTATGHRSRRP